ncbi:MAG: 30S ribosomal protein S17, partial [Methanoregula sp.]|nr:30S ribosomal protein S17 [Methanoregula sp.]
MALNIGLDVQAPKQECQDVNCPFHGTLPVRGQVITG